MKQTAIQWLEEQLQKCMKNYYPISGLVEQAKEMEKKMVIDAGNSCAMKSHLHRDKIDQMTEDELKQHLENDVSTTFGEEYYNENYIKSSQNN